MVQGGGEGGRVEGGLARGFWVGGMSGVVGDPLNDGLSRRLGAGGTGKELLLDL